jgi:hypothetical protein
VTAVAGSGDNCDGSVYGGVGVRDEENVTLVTLLYIGDGCGYETGGFGDSIVSSRLVTAVFKTQLQQAKTYNPTYWKKCAKPLS